MHTAGPQPTALQQGTVFYFKAAGRRVALQQSSEFFSSFGVAAATLSNHHAKRTNEITTNYLIKSCSLNFGLCIPLLLYYYYVIFCGWYNGNCSYKQGKIRDLFVLLLHDKLLPTVRNAFVFFPSCQH
jgi:hypothetical protein